MSLVRYSPLLFALAISTAGIAQSDEGQAPKTPVFKVSTTLVAVDVVATDASGSAISDLKQEELKLFEDGKERPITRFVYDRADANSPERQAFSERVKQTLAQLPPGVTTNLGAIGTVPNDVASTVILVDGLNTPFESRAYARQQMLKLLGSLQQKQPVAIYGLTNSLTLLQDFTTDAAILRAAAARASVQPAALGVTGDAVVDHSGSDAMGDLLPDQVYARTREFENDLSAQYLDVRVQRTLDALNSIARRLQSVPGRKNLIWLSSVFPLDLYPDGGFIGSSVRHYADQLSATLTNLENSRIAIYPVDANGLQVGSIASSMSRPNSRTLAGRGFLNAQTEWSREISSSHDTMNLVAEKTGGKAFYNRNDLAKAIETAIEDGSAYYSLTFRPANPDSDGKLHRLKLTSSRKGVKLRYRQAYVSLERGIPSKERINYMRQEMSDALTEKQHLATGILLYARPDADGAHIDLIVDGHFLVFANSENDRVRVQFQVATATFDAKGKVLDSGADVVGKDLDAKDVPAFLRQGAHFRAPFQRTDQVKRVRIAVRDLASDRIGTVDVRLN